jgi:hypothetical protein
VMKNSKPEITASEISMISKQIVEYLWAILNHHQVDLSDYQALLDRPIEAAGIEDALRQFIELVCNGTEED